KEVLVDALPASIQAAASRRDAPFDGQVRPMRELQRKYASWALEQLGGNKTRTAASLEVDVKTLSKWLAEDAPPSAAADSAEGAAAASASQYHLVRCPFPPRARCAIAAQ